MCSFGCCLSLPGIAQEIDVLECLGDRGFEVSKIDRLSNEIERTTVHCRPDIGHIPISRDNNGRDVFLGIL